MLASKGNKLFKILQQRLLAVSGPANFALTVKVCLIFRKSLFNQDTVCLSPNGTLYMLQFFYSDVKLRKVQESTNTSLVHQTGPQSTPVVNLSAALMCCAWGKTEPNNKTKI